MKAYLVGSGIAGLAAAAHLIRDAGLPPAHVTIFEAEDRIGGAMSAFGDARQGYSLPSGRIFEERFACARDLFSLVPWAEDPERTIWQEIVAFNLQHGYDARVRLIGPEGPREVRPHMGLSLRDRLDLVKLALTPEAMLEGRAIAEFFEPAFFETDFWMLWTSTMNALPQHSAAEFRRFMNRFLHIFPDLPRMTKIWRTPRDQADVFAGAVAAWLRAQGVVFEMGTTVCDVAFDADPDRVTAVAIETRRGGRRRRIGIGAQDIVLVTAGSQAADLSLGSMTRAPQERRDGRAWALWRRLAQARPGFGRPEVFFGEEALADTRFMTFTVTTRDDTLPRLYAALTGAALGRGGIQTLTAAPWGLTTAAFHQPKFRDQPPEVTTWWGLAVSPDRPGSVLRKPMAACTGREVLEETLTHLGFGARAEEIVAQSICIPCLLPHAGSVWRVRRADDRAPVVPEGSTNFGFLGQFADMPGETVYTMEYSIRTARVALSRLCGCPEPPGVYRGRHDPQALRDALKALA